MCTPFRYPSTLINSSCSCNKFSVSVMGENPIIEIPSFRTRRVLVAALKMSISNSSFFTPDFDRPLKNTFAYHALLIKSVVNGIFALLVNCTVTTTIFRLRKASNWRFSFHNLWSHSRWYSDIEFNTYDVWNHV